MDFSDITPWFEPRSSVLDFEVAADSMKEHHKKSDSDASFRWIVAQEGSRRGYAIPVAFHRLGWLRLLYADIWCRGGRKLLKKWGSATRALAGRFNSEIPADRVISFSPSAITRKLAHGRGVGSGSREKMGHNWCDFGEWFGRRVKQRLADVELDPEQDVFFGFDTNCLEAINYLRKRRVFTVVAQVDPALFEEDLVMAESEMWPGWERTTGRMPQRYWDRRKEEWLAADMVGVNSEWSKQALVKQGVPAKKIFIVPLAIDLLKRPHVEKPRKNISGGTLRVLWVGSVILRKGIQYLVGAARLLLNEDIEFLIAGEIGIQRGIIDSFPNNIKMLGKLGREEAAAIYSKGNVFVLPTLSDGFAVTQLEAMAAGLPVISTPNCGQVVTDGVDGFIIPPGNAEALADTLNRLHHDRNLLNTMSLQAQMTIRRFDLPSNARAINRSVNAHKQQCQAQSTSTTVLNSSVALSPGIATVAPEFSRAFLNSKTRFALPPKAVVCFSGSRDRYQVPLAMEEAGLLQKLVTDHYGDPRKIPFGTRLARRFPKLLARHVRGLPRDMVITPPRVMVDSLLMKTDFGNENRQIRLDGALGRRARQEAWQSKAALFSYSYYAAGAFAPGERRPPMRFLFQLHPHPAAVREILRQELVRVPKFAASLRWEHELGAPETHFQSLCSESRLANGWVAASSFTAKTLADRGIPRHEIHVVPYGVNAEMFPRRGGAPPENDPFRVIWIGSMTQRKGLSYFLEAIGSLPQENLEVLICGNHAVDRAVIEGYGIKSVRVFQALPTAELTRLLRSCDLFVLPSLAEGFAHVILEAMSSGIPVLTTAFTCAPDVLEDGAHGFIVPIRDALALANKITWARAHRCDLYRMGLAAAARARLFTWERFRKGIVNAYEQMVETHRLRAEECLLQSPSCRLH